MSTKPGIPHCDSCAPEFSCWGNRFEPCRKQEASGALFDSRLLSRALLSNKAAARFRDESRQAIRIDQETDARVVCYIHPDGRILIDAVRIRKPK